MEPLPAAPDEADARFATRFRARAGGDGPVSFADFMELALFDPQIGYYTAARERVGKGRGTDFYTSSTFAGVFGPLVAAAAEALLGGRAPAASHTFVEIGSEPERALLAGAPQAFAAVRAFGLTDHLTCGDPRLPDRAVVFSNELFDAQPFHRLIWRDGAWREQGVALHGGGLAWAELPGLSPELDPVRPELPVSSENGYILDVPWRAVRLLRALTAGSWQGLFLAFDYGRTWRQISEDFPGGTGRAYAAHRQSSDLLAMPGRQDLTCHVCWDWLERALRDAGFVPVRRDSQESFLVRNATAAIEAIVRAEPNPLASRRSQLKQVLHPGLLGQRFEVLWGLRR
mgnify:CR=1 FL=1